MISLKKQHSFQCACVQKRKHSELMPLEEPLTGAIIWQIYESSYSSSSIRPLSGKDKFNTATAPFHLQSIYAPLSYCFSDP